MAQIAVLDFTTGGMYLFDYDSDKYGDREIQDFFDDIKTERDIELLESNCQWMINEELDIEDYRGDEK